MEIKLSQTERLILANQYKILAKVEPENSGQFNYLKEILERGYEGLYYYLFEGIDSEGISKSVTDETHEILTMYRRIKPSIENSENPDIDQIKFKGFDGNHQSHYHIMKFMVEDLGLYSEYKDSYYNSHSQIPLTKYRDMLQVYKTFNLEYFAELTNEQIQQLIDA
jgi:uncharacterized protein YfbU (UPF0304 family)